MIIYSWQQIQAFVSKEESPFELSAGSGIAIGSFDGLHTGHRKIIKTLVKNCERLGIPAGVVTFNRPLPLFKHSEDYAGDISTLEQRLSILESLGVKFVIVLDFNDVFNISGTDFLSIIKNVCNMRIITEGVDFRCGYKGATDSTAIKYWAEQNEVETAFIEPVLYKPGTDEEERISSSYIRQMLLKGFFRSAAELLERDYELALPDSIIKGMNVIDREVIAQVLPPQGIYHVKSATQKMLRLEITETELLLQVDDDEKIKSVLF